MSQRLAQAFRLNVQDRMRKMGVTQTELAKRMGVTVANVNHFLTGYRNPGLESLESFAEALETTASRLLEEKKLSKAS